jgi:hypothetical protein
MLQAHHEAQKQKEKASTIPHEDAGKDSEEKKETSLDVAYMHSTVNEFSGMTQQQRVQQLIRVFVLQSHTQRGVDNNPAAEKGLQSSLQRVDSALERTSSMIKNVDVDSVGHNNQERAGDTADGSRTDSVAHMLATLQNASGEDVTPNSQDDLDDVTVDAPEGVCMHCSPCAYAYTRYMYESFSVPVDLSACETWLRLPNSDVLSVFVF